MEYANGDVSTPMGKQRAANGHPEPYHVKFWGIGNEMWGITYQYGAMKLNQFEYQAQPVCQGHEEGGPDHQTDRLRRHAGHHDRFQGIVELGHQPGSGLPLTRRLDRRTAFKNCFDNIDLLSDHFYNYGNTHFSLAEGRQVPNDPNEPITDWMRRPANHIRIKYEEYKEYEKLIPELVTHPKPLNIDEWAYMGGTLSRLPVLRLGFP